MSGPATQRAAAGQGTDKVRQAVVIIHGMGEQRPLETLNGFIRTGLKPDDDGKRTYYSRPDVVTESYESRRYLAPPASVDGSARTQTEFYEYHWAHLMQGNLFTDMVPTFLRLLFTPPWHTPRGLLVIWAIFWSLLVAVGLLFLTGHWWSVDLSQVSLESVVRAVTGGGLLAFVLTYLVTHILPSWLTTSFVDVVRYLDTSPRSYAVRRDIRAGILELLRGLHSARMSDGKLRYQRIVIVAHSLGSYIAYDAIAYLWAEMNKLHGPLPSPGGAPDGVPPAGLEALEILATKLSVGQGTPQQYQDAQRTLWLGLRAHGNPWLITDFVSVGSPMYFAHRLYTRNPTQFADRVAKRELPKCPPLPDLGPNAGSTHRYSWDNQGRRVLYEGAPFAVTRWTNLWYPPGLGFFGDWFGGPLRPLFGPGVIDVPLRGDLPWRLAPGWAHTRYFKFGDSSDQRSAAAQLRQTMELGADDWLTPTFAAPDPDPATA